MDVDKRQISGSTIVSGKIPGVWRGSQLIAPIFPCKCCSRSVRRNGLCFKVVINNIDKLHLFVENLRANLQLWTGKTCKDNFHLKTRTIICMRDVRYRICIVCSNSSEVSTILNIFPSNDENILILSAVVEENLEFTFFSNGYKPRKFSTIGGEKFE